MKRRKGRLVFWALLLAALGWAFYYSNYHISVEAYEIAGAPAGFAGFKILQISDLHARELGEGNKDLISKVAEQSPDIIVITGDLIDKNSRLEVVTGLLRKLVAIAPVYFVTGNHEYSGELRQLRLIMDEIGVTELANEYVKLERGGDTIVLAGVEDPNGDVNMKKPSALLEEIFENEGEGAYVVLLAHRYDLAEHYAEIGSDLIICGHAHGGLVRLPFTDGLIGPGRDFLPEHTSGYYEIGSSRLIVSRGLASAEGAPRLFNSLHVPVIIFK